MQIISDLVRVRAEDSGQGVFCSFRGRRTTFEQLRNGVQEMAGALIEVGVKPGDRVGLMLSSSVEHMELFLAIAWIGAIAVPFSIHLKSAGLELQLNSAKPRVLLANRVHADAIRQALTAITQPLSVVWFEADVDREGEFHLDALLRASRAVLSSVARSADHPLLISYTSGTTGAPKGGVLSERFFWVGTKNAAILSEAHPDDTYFLWEPFYHGAWSTVAIALQKGCSIHMVERFSASRLWDQIAEGGATKLHYLGGLVNMILSQPGIESERNNNISIAWGAACPADSWRQFEERFELKVREGYGLTEGQNFTHMNLHGVVGSMGTPIEELECWVIDDHGKRVGPGVAGELVLKPKVASVVMSGYWGEPERTAEVLRDGCVYTGDLVMFDEDGHYYFKGRKKDAMRRRGENVSAWEVERVINAAPGVEESAVLGVSSTLGQHEQEILAVVKLRDGTNPDPLSILKYCEQRLAYYQVPRFLQFVNDFPRGPSQRIQKKEIVADLQNAWDAEKAGVKPTRTV
ncbi:AMP-binding protein [Bradyrhizobium arachidis]|uniref:AMP-binding protein n=1 Tax=Bradyrhizobium arachidis TaxID=858423 RepID=UPI00216174AC|nr:AMP-binding protein [Bradyrhizobium arachidis]UVO35786.1 AMP-binding protein [Bradyrhizobium arachidis]